MKNAYAKEQAELRRQLLNYGALVGQQFNVDMMCLALNEEGFGHDRIMRIIHRAEKHGEYFHECLAYGVESDARFEQLDQRLRYICRDHPEDFVPREERYPNVKVPGMGKKFKAEPIGPCGAFPPQAERMPASIARTGRKRKFRKKNGPYTEPTRCIHVMSTASDWTARI